MPCHVYATTAYMCTALSAFTASIKVLKWEGKSFRYSIQIYVCNKRVSEGCSQKNCLG